MKVGNGTKERIFAAENAAVAGCASIHRSLQSQGICTPDKAQDLPHIRGANQCETRRDIPSVNILCLWTHSYTNFGLVWTTEANDRKDDRELPHRVDNRSWPRQVDQINLNAKSITTGYGDGHRMRSGCE